MVQQFIIFIFDEQLSLIWLRFLSARELAQGCANLVALRADIVKATVFSQIGMFLNAQQNIPNAFHVNTQINPLLSQYSGAATPCIGSIARRRGRRQGQTDSA